MRLLCLLLLSTSLVVIGCVRKSALNSNANQLANAQAQSSDQQSPQPSPGDGTTGKLEQNQQPAGTQTTPPPEPPKFRVPSFMDQINGGAKDLPNYPNMRLVNMFYGPQPPGYDSLNIDAQTGDSIDKVTAFYEKAFKTNGWKVVNSVKSPERVEWLLKKGDKNDGTVIAQKDPQTNLITLKIVRAEKLSDAGQ